MPDILGNASTTATLSIGASTVSAIDTNGDHDWFVVNLTAGVQVTFTVFGITLVDPILNLISSSNTVVASNDDIKNGQDRNSLVTFTPTRSGIYYVDVAAFNDSYTGSYQVSMQAGTQAPVATVDTIAGYMVQGAWGGDAHHFAATQGGTITVNMTMLNASEQNLARAALQEWSDVIGIKFQEVTTGGQITFDNTEQTAGTPVAQTDDQWSNGITSSAHVQISTSWVNRYGTGLNTYSFQTYLHEIGHALGLGHSGDYNGTATYPTDALFANDAWSTTVMSYFDQNQNSYFANQSFSKALAVTPMEADIAAMQTLYGLSTTTRVGDTVYGFNSNAGGMYDAVTYPNVAVTIFDSGGNDTIDYSGSSANQLINLNPDTFSNVNGRTGNLEIGRGVVIENAIGGSGADTIIGNGAANTLTGGAGHDVLTGGAGNDTFKDTASNLNGDTITDFSAGDRIWITDATLSSFTYSLSGNTLTYTNGSLTFGATFSGSLVATAAATGGVVLSVNVTPPIASITGDFNGDGRADVVWRSNTGVVTDSLGQTNGALLDNSANTGQQIPLSWTIVGSGDFNGDGRADLIWRHTSGEFAMWLGQANGGFVHAGSPANAAGTDWAIVGTGDFNGDGRSDILWRHTSGAIAEWLGQPSGTFINNGAAASSSPTDSTVVGTGDFNGDGRTDVIWRNSSGELFMWLGQVNGGFVNGGHPANAVGLDWSVAGTGDFNGDGRDDILWRHSSGQIDEWLGKPDGSFINNGTPSGPIPASGWTIAGIGDFNGDHRDDVLWRVDSTQVTTFLGQANGGFALGGTSSAQQPLAASSSPTPTGTGSSSSSSMAEFSMNDVEALDAMHHHDHFIDFF